MIAGDRTFAGWACRSQGRRYNERMSGTDDVRPASSGVKLTYDDYVLFPEDGKRHELIDGEHYVTPTPVRKHQALVGNLQCRA